MIVFYIAKKIQYAKNVGFFGIYVDRVFMFMERDIALESTVQTVKQKNRLVLLKHESVNLSVNTKYDYW